MCPVMKWVRQQKKIAFRVEDKSISSREVFWLLSPNFAQAFKHIDNFWAQSYFQERLISPQSNWNFTNIKSEYLFGPHNTHFLKKTYLYYVQWFYELFCFFLSVGLYVRWIQLLLTVDLVQSSCVSESADQNSGLAPRNSTLLWYDCNYATLLCSLI